MLQLNLSMDLVLLAVGCCRLRASKSSMCAKPSGQNLLCPAVLSYPSFLLSSSLVRVDSSCKQKVLCEKDFSPAGIDTTFVKLLDAKREREGM